MRRHDSCCNAPTKIMPAPSSPRSFFSPSARSIFSHDKISPPQKDFSPRHAPSKKPHARSRIPPLSSNRHKSLHETVTNVGGRVCYNLCMSVKEELNKSLDKVFVPTTRAEAPTLHASIEKLCAKAGIEKPEICFVDVHAPEVKFSELQKLNLEYGCAALDLGKPRILVGEKFRGLMGHHGANGVVSEELEAIFAHEIGHLKHGDPTLLKGNLIRLSPHLGALAGLVGVLYYEHLQKKSEIARQAGVPEEQIKQDIHTEWQASDAPHPHVPTMMDHATKIAKCVAGGLLGFGVGTAVFALAHRHMEFRADRVSAELMGDGKPLARALQQLRTNARNAIPPEILNKAREETGALEKFFSQFTHPSTDERIERLNNWSR